MLRLIFGFFVLLLCHGHTQEWEQCCEGLFPEYQNHPLDLIEDFLPENPVIFEAGAHYGDDTLRFLKKWPLSTILSFEPNPHAFEILQSQTQNHPNIHLYPFALNSVSEAIRFYVCHGENNDNPIFEGASSVLEPTEVTQKYYRGPVIEVQGVNLDEWCEAQNIDHIDFVWLDLEGFELPALRSSPKILNTIQAIYTETNFLEFRKGTTQYKDLKAFLESQGFKLVSHWYAKHKFLYRHSDGNFQGNALFVKKNLYEKIIPELKCFGFIDNLPSE